MDIVEAFWNEEVARGAMYTLPCLNLTPEIIEEFAAGLRESIPGACIFPRSVLKDVKGKNVLCLASGGGQQSAVFGLLGAHVTVLDICEGQLEGDRTAAEHHGYNVDLVKGDMCDLSVFPDGKFDLVYQPISICFVPDVRVVYREVFRVLKPGGTYKVGHVNPATFPACFEGGSNGWDGAAYRIADPYVGGPLRKSSDGVENMTDGEPTGEYRHLLTEIFGGLTELGFIIRDVCEDPRHLQGGAIGEPGSHEHYLSVIAEYFSIVCVKP